MHFPFPPDTVHFNPRFREGSDFVCRGKRGGLGDFNPRSREGSDRSRMASSYVPDVFQSTLPRRERRDLLSFFTNVYLISIHAPAKGATQAHCASCLHYTFQSTLPRRERPERQAQAGKAQAFQSTLPRRERRPRISSPCVYSLFQSTLPRRERR